jgi:hypothetical protein
VGGSCRPPFRASLMGSVEEAMSYRSIVLCFHSSVKPGCGRAAGSEQAELDLLHPYSSVQTRWLAKRSLSQYPSTAARDPRYRSLGQPSEQRVWVAPAWSADMEG